MTPDMLVKYNVTDAAIAEMSDRYMGLVVKDPTDAEGFKAARNARIIVKGKRVEVEKARVELKADALKYGRAVDTEAKRITALLHPIEEHLITQERVVTDEKKRVEREAEEAERARLDALEKAKREAEEAVIRAEREAEAKKLAEERERLAAERVEMEAERARVAKELAAERECVEAEQKVERERLAAIAAVQKVKEDELLAAKLELAQQEAKRQIAADLERAKVTAVAKAKAGEEEAKLRSEAAMKLVEALRPDAEKIRTYGTAVHDALRTVLIPELDTPGARKFLCDAAHEIGRIATDCCTFSAGGDEPC